jgi:molybdopterin synthase sulfur carrier subunit
MSGDRREDGMEWQLFADLSDVAGDDRVAVDVAQDATVRDAVEALVADRPALRERVLADDGSLHAHVNVLVNGENVRAAGEDGLDTPVEPDDELAMFPPVSGG